MAGLMELTRLSVELLPDCGGWTVMEEVAGESLRGKDSKKGPRDTPCS